MDPFKFRISLGIGGVWIFRAYSKFSFGEVYCRTYDLKFSYMATGKRSRKTWFPTIYQTIYLPKWKFWHVCRAWSGYKLFAKLISRQQKMPLACKESMAPFICHNCFCMLFFSSFKFILCLFCKLKVSVITFQSWIITNFPPYKEITVD